MIFPESKRLRLLRVREAGADRERVLIRVLRPCNVGRYAIIGCRFDGDGYYPTNRHTYWFPDADVDAGDLIVLRTSSGVDGASTNVEGHATHRFHWGLPKAVWSLEQIPCLVYIGTAQFADEIM